MTAYLDEEMFGRDDDTIGFPHLLFCIGIIVITARDLFGVHSSLQTDSEQVYGAFLDFCESRQMNRVAPIDVCSAVDVPARYPERGEAGWVREMGLFCDIFNFRGTVNGFDTSSIRPRDGTYIEVHRGQDNPRPFLMLYKRNEKTILGPRNPVPVASDADVVAYNVRRGVVRNHALPTSSVTGRSSLLHRGTFHEVGYSQLCKHGSDGPWCMCGRPLRRHQCRRRGEQHRISMPDRAPA
jgi:hypothetical protein